MTFTHELLKNQSAGETETNALVGMLCINPLLPSNMHLSKWSFAKYIRNGTILLSSEDTVIPHSVFSTVKDSSD